MPKVLETFVEKKYTEMSDLVEDMHRLPLLMGIICKKYAGICNLQRELLHQPFRVPGSGIPPTLVNRVATQRINNVVFLIIAT